MKVSARYYSQEVIDEIRARTDIVSVVSEYVKLRKSGKNYVGLCPFHQEKTPSFTVDPEKQFFYCFGCGEGGNIFTFLMKMENMSFPDAVEKLAARAGVRLPEPTLSSSEKKRKQELDGVRNVLSFAHEKYRQVLFSKQGAHALKYLEKRGVLRGTIDLFELGYAPAQWDFIVGQTGKAGISPDSLVKSGLVVEKEIGRGGESKTDLRLSNMYDRFRGRIMFPIWNSTGDLIGFAGRAVGNDEPKYLNSPDTPLFHKGKELYALNLAKTGIRNKGRVCVMEGYMDVISAFQNGIDYAVAGMGTAFSAQQARALLLLCEDVVLAYDQDDAGKRAVRRCIDVFREAGGRSRVAVFEGAKDPDEYVIKYGAEKFEGLVANAVTDIEFIYREAVRANDLSTIEGKLKVKDIIVPVLAELESDVEISAYVSEIARDLDVMKESLYKDVELYRRKARRASTKSSDSNASRPTSQNNLPRNKSKEVNLARRRAEEGIIKVLVEKPELVNVAKMHLTGEDFSDEQCRLMFANCDDLLVWTEDPEISNWVAQICAGFGPIDRPERVLADCIRRINEFRLAELRDEMRKAEEDGDQERLVAILYEYQKLLRQVKSTGDENLSGFPGDFSGREDG